MCDIFLRPDTWDVQVIPLVATEMSMQCWDERMWQLMVQVLVLWKESS